jgi:hypothetical protein
MPSPLSGHARKARSAPGGPRGLASCGHYGIFSGRRWRTVIYPQLRDFIAEHDRVPRREAEEFEA